MNPSQAYPPIQRAHLQGSKATMPIEDRVTRHRHALLVLVPEAQTPDPKASSSPAPGAPPLLKPGQAESWWPGRAWRSGPSRIPDT